MGALTVIATVTIALLAWPVVNTFRHYRKAQRIGLPIVITPVVPLNPFWLVLIPLLGPLTSSLPGYLGEFLNYGSFTWYFQTKMRVLEKLGPAFVIVSPGGMQIQLCDGHAVEEILYRSNDFPKPASYYHALDVFGENLDTANGREWQRHRKITTPPFNEMNSNMVWIESLRQAKGMLRSWSHAGEAGTIETSQDTMNLALHVLTGAGFGRFYPFEKGVSSPASGHTMSFKEALHTVLNNFIGVLLLSNSKLMAKLLPKRFDAIRTAIPEFKQYLVEFVKEERANPQKSSEHDNLMSALLRASDLREVKGEGRGTLTDDEVYGNLFIYAFAGHESTANILAYAITLLAANLKVQDWIREEVQAVASEYGAVENWKYEEMFPRLRRCLALMFETLRLYGPVVAFPRAVNESYQTLTIQGKQYTIPPHTVIFGTFTAVHASEYWGSEPYDWKPERWILKKESEHDIGREEMLQPPLSAFTPWSSGPRICPGKKFAQVEFVATLALLFQHHRVKPMAEPGESPSGSRTRLLRSVEDSDLTTTLKMNHPEKVRLCWEKVS
ncbi:11-oxo-beta-amyrin 30-oxidase [Lachnellula occidentalis]|uniref:11-oxo-beta-amyrin 30-oxidase n=1 Tax=Lachnellula occidentalis TaxID=215460 RepID=A0A8H8UCI5_9HELO|nr:11-oxo-beta-amyrin 30-oxidase [Lachnellula occidentalis]